MASKFPCIRCRVFNGVWKFFLPIISCRHPSSCLYFSWILAVQSSIDAPNNGDVDLTLSRGSDAASENDDWNLVGNPYPSSISAAAFLAANENLDGFINLWTHGAPPSNTLPAFLPAKPMETISFKSWILRPYRAILALSY